MKTTVINIKDRQFAEQEVYIGRAGKGEKDGTFCNPVARMKKCPVCGDTHFSPGSTLGCYTTYLWNRLKNDSAFREKVEGLAGKTLVCFCSPNPCHGYILAAATEWLSIHKEDLPEECPAEIVKTLTRTTLMPNGTTGG